MRLNHHRLKGENGPEDQNVSLNILFEVILNTCIVMASYVPFMTEMMYQNLRKCIPTDNADYYEESLHFLLWPKYDDSLLNSESEGVMKTMQNLTQAVWKLREKTKMNLRKPVMSITLISND